MQHNYDLHSQYWPLVGQELLYLIFASMLVSNITPPLCLDQLVVTKYPHLRYSRCGPRPNFIQATNC